MQAARLLLFLAVFAVSDGLFLLLVAIWIGLAY
jgi:hypothetical protein